MKSFAVAAVTLVGSTTTTTGAFTFVAPRSQHPSRTALGMGMFDGVKEAFSAPALERSTLDAERETPIDRWFGWNVRAGDPQASLDKAVDGSGDNFVDSMDAVNYVSVELAKPMGIVFEENENDSYGGIYVVSLNEDGVAAQDGTLQVGDQLVAVGSSKVAGMAFDDAIGAIVNSQEEKTKLLLFRGQASQFYGPTGPSQEWLNNFIAS